MTTAKMEQKTFGEVNCKARKPTEAGNVFHPFEPGTQLNRTLLYTLYLSRGVHVGQSSAPRNAESIGFVDYCGWWRYQRPPALPDASYRPPCKSYVCCTM